MYPKTFFESNRLAEKPGSWFVVMPFDLEFEPVSKR
jgi:hypothetical protein